MDPTSNASRIRSRHRITAELKARVLARHGNVCAVCRASANESMLDIAHIVPISSGGDSSEDNLTVVCQNCNLSLSVSPREGEFVQFLAALMDIQPQFNDVKLGVLVGANVRYRADISASRDNRDGTERLLIECKSPEIFESTGVEGTIAQLRSYQDIDRNARTVLAVPSTLSEEVIGSLREAEIEVWDLPWIASHFRNEIERVDVSPYSLLFLSRIVYPHGSEEKQSLMRQLESCRPGREDCYVYQSLVGDVLEHLFFPALSKPIAEVSDRTGVNRRDFIVPNYADAGFWAFLRQEYDADYVVVDAKNYTGKIGKDEVLQLANYLKPHGAGLFGIIFSRNGGDRHGCDQTIREQWMMHRKLILVLNDDDVRSMLTAKSDGRAVEDYLGGLIERFRLSM